MTEPFHVAPFLLFRVGHSAERLKIHHHSPSISTSYLLIHHSCRITVVHTDVSVAIITWRSCGGIPPSALHDEEYIMYYIRVVFVVPQGGGRSVTTKTDPSDWYDKYSMSEVEESNKPVDCQGK